MSQENKMGVMPINKLLISMSLPMIISMLVQALYNIVDSVFVSMINQAALTAVSMAFPIQNLLIAVSAGTCVGVNALLSRSLGEKNSKAANLAAANGLFLAFLSFLAFAVFGLFGSRLFFESQTNNPVIIEYGVQYLQIVCIFCFGLFGEMMFERILQSTGQTFYCMITQGTGAIINIILDPILIFGLFGVPKMGIQGAAAATVFGQIVAMFLALILNHTKNKEVRINFRSFTPNWRTISIIYQVGVPSIIMQSISSVMTFGMNKILIGFSETAVAVFGVYFKLQSFIFMPIFGLNNGMIPIVAYNYGARSKKRIMETVWLSIGIAVGIMLIGLMVFHLMTPQLLMLFQADEEMLAIGVPALRIISLSFLFAGYCIIVGSVFQALGNGVYSLIISMSLPMIISMLVQALYNIVDSVFVSMINQAALTAVSMAFPIQNLLIAVSAGTCVGVNALLSRSLGEKNSKAANLAAANGLFLAFLSFLAFAVFGLFGSRLFFESQTNNPVIIEYGVQYLQIVCIFCFGLFGEMMFERILQSTGQTFYCMITQGTGAIINIILDPILIFGLFGVPKMGIQGAAAATVFGQIVAMFLALILNHTKNKEVRINFRSFTPNWRTISIIYQVGVPSIIMQSISSVMTFGMNKILIGFSETAVAVFGVYFKLQSFIFMPIFGLNNGMIPIVAYNYGARSKKRIMETVWLSIGIAVGIMLIGLMVFHLMTPQLLMLFQADEEMLAIGVPALRIISLSFLFAGYCIIVGSVFQALGNGVYSLIISVARQLVCILPLAWFFARTFGLHAVWLSLPLAEITSVVLSSILFRKIYLDKIKPLGQAAA